MNRAQSAFTRWIAVVADVFRVSPIFRVLIYLQVVLVALLIAGYTVAGHDTVTYNYANKTICIKTTTALPRLQKITNAPFSVQLTDEKKLFGYPVIATAACVTPTQAPAENTKIAIRISPFPKGFFAKQLTVDSKAYPQLAKQLSSISVVSVHDPLTLPLSSADKTFHYLLLANSKKVSCSTADNGKSISCDPTGLELKHAERYSFALARVFGTTAEPMANSAISSATIQTVTPVAVTGASITPGATIYNKPQSITVTVDKKIASAKDIKLLDDTGAEVPVATAVTDKTLTISFTTELVRGKRYVLTVGNVISTDSGSFIKPYELLFTPAKGPRVSSVNIGTSGVPWGQSIELLFDQPIQATDIGKRISLTDSNGAPLAASVTSFGSGVVINPAANFSKCARFKITVDSTVASPYGISGESGWSYSSRATCFESFSIGKSVKGRSITGYKIGSGAAILYVGGIHGSEQNSTKILQKWLIELDANPEKVPVNRSIVVIPSVSPDGYAQNSRTNANGINLNRNFPTNNWKADVKEPSGKVLIGGGGVTALDQPESAALAAYVQALRPVMVMSYHSSGGVAVSNDAGNSRAMADAYAKKTGYVYKNNDTIGNFFDYDTTGAFEDWMHDKQNTPLILVELYSKYDDEFSRNKAAMWFIAQSTNF